MSKELVALGIETSCDDTSVCLMKKNSSGEMSILSHLHYSQESFLAQWGGVVPELAARNHLQKVGPLLIECYQQAGLTPEQTDLIGVTTYPGLVGPLLTGLNAAKTLSLIHHIPILAVNHLFAHLEAIHLTEKINYPYLGVLVSGGHSMFVKVDSADKLTVLGSTTDDAAGEAFDKGGKLMGLGYPAGKIIDELGKKGLPSAIKFPIGLQHENNPNMSFSGLKTALRLYLEKHPSPLSAEQTWDLCASYQEAIVQALALKAKKAIKKWAEDFPEDFPKQIPLVVGGGVACNSRLRAVFLSSFKHTHFVAPKFCTDNGAMIAHWALLNNSQATAFPQCLDLDVRGRFVDKQEFITHG